MCCIISIKKKKKKNCCEDPQWNINGIKCQMYFSALDTSHNPPGEDGYPPLLCRSKREKKERKKRERSIYL